MALSKRECGGTIVNVITALVFFGLLGYGIMWLRLCPVSDRVGPACLDVANL